MELHGLFNTKPIILVSALQVKRLVQKRDCAIALIMLRDVKPGAEEEEAKSSSNIAYLQQPFFQPYLDLFPDELPTTLPTRRPVDHPIDLIPDQPPPIRAPYRVNTQSAILTCETCGEDFDSRNQLFKHISATKHAILKGK
ncbi:hypothetical protein GOP47_0011472 [Adiantum capillus-veneris]|uniref:C2H2-type domain-containing protein n=1 Tax=Adiantum capillus-veneris TaxID=13818 RepID=A0A9D4USV4_ADICA|nr:hypothetical protein GOP47_0011472 [Adiantum capillus-veneris]